MNNVSGRGQFVAKCPSTGTSLPPATTPGKESPCQPTCPGSGMKAHRKSAKSPLLDFLEGSDSSAKDPEDVGTTAEPQAQGKD